MLATLVGAVPKAEGFPPCQMAFKSDPGISLKSDPPFGSIFLGSISFQVESFGRCLRRWLFGLSWR